MAHRGPLVAVFLANILLIDRLGWVISGAILVLGQRVGARVGTTCDALVAVALSVLTFYGFYLGLGIYLPAGILEGVL